MNLLHDTVILFGIFAFFNVYCDFDLCNKEQRIVICSALKTFRLLI